MKGQAKSKSPQPNSNRVGVVSYIGKARKNGQETRSRSKTPTSISHGQDTNIAKGSKAFNTKLQEYKTLIQELSNLTRQIDEGVKEMETTAFKFNTKAALLEGLPGQQATEELRKEYGILFN